MTSRFRSIDGSRFFSLRRLGWAAIAALMTLVILILSSRSSLTWADVPDANPPETAAAPF